MKPSGLGFLISQSSLDQLGMSKNGLARRCGHSPAHLSLLMAGRHSPSPRTRRRQQQVLGVGDYDSLFILGNRGRSASAYLNKPA